MTNQHIMLDLETMGNNPNAKLTRAQLDSERNRELLGVALNDGL